MKRPRKEVPENLRCIAMVYTPEQMRRTGRGKYGFELHYIKHQCTRKAKKDSYCGQHQYKAIA